MEFTTKEKFIKVKRMERESFLINTKITYITEIGQRIFQMEMVLNHGIMGALLMKASLKKESKKDLGNIMKKNLLMREILKAIKLTIKDEQYLKMVISMMEFGKMEK